MKKIFPFVLLLLTGNICFSQYTVTKVVGQVTNRTSGEKLKPGSKLRDDDLLAFSTSSDLVRVIVSGKGVYIITPNPPTQTEPSVLVEVLKTALKIKSREGYLSGRSDDDPLVPAAFETETKVNTHHLIQPVNKYLFDLRNYPMSGGNKFFIQADMPGENPVIHALGTVADTLYINVADLTGTDSTIKEKYTLGYFSKEKGSSESVAIIRPYADLTGEMETIMQVVINSNKKSDRSSLQKICYAEVYESLGKPSDIGFRTAFNKLTARMFKK